MTSSPNSTSASTKTSARGSISARWATSATSTISSRSARSCSPTSSSANSSASSSTRSPAPQAPPEPIRTVDELIFGTRNVAGVDVIVTAPADGIDLTVDRLRTALWAAVPIAMLLTGLVTWLLAGRALRPVRVITEHTGQIRAGTLHERVPVPASHDEVAGLATEMNDMLDRLQREDQRRRQFIADASHELRSPIASIHTQAEVAISDGTSTRHHRTRRAACSPRRNGSAPSSTTCSRSLVTTRRWHRRDRWSTSTTSSWPRPLAPGGCRCRSVASRAARFEDTPTSWDAP